MRIFNSAISDSRAIQIARGSGGIVVWIHEQRKRSGVVLGLVGLAPKTAREIAAYLVELAGEAE